MKGLFKKLTLSISALLIITTLTELALRIVNYNYSPMKIKGTKTNDWRAFHSFEDKHFVYDPYLIWSPRKNFSIFNSQGFRGEELGLKKDGEFRIFAIGDSNTLGWQGEDGPNWPLYLGNLLQESSNNIKVINAGVWGYSSFQGLRRFKQVLRFQPDMVLISFGGNDAHHVSISDAEYTQRKKDTYYAILSRFRLGRLLIAFFDKISIQKDIKREKLVPRVSLEEYRDNLKEIIDLSRARGIIPVLLTRPFIGNPPDELNWLNFAPHYNKVVTEVAEREKVPMVDIYSYFKDKPTHFIDDSHFTRAGHKIAAILIYEKISSLIPIGLKRITLNDHIDINKSKKIVPKDIEFNLMNFYDDGFILTNGDGRIFDIKYDIKPDDRYLVLHSLGWHPYINNIEKLGLNLFINGKCLEFHHRDGNSFYFLLRKDVKQIHEIQIMSSTFVPKELGINNDTRRIGVDIASIEIK